ncbi:glycosyltransferase family 4 protein [Kutzneria chonburiensis]|uniref:Glycosyltransferase family 4 protein n=1 Tax=Kutzneria chonburiensis TaxID=1483604 RepID=A0ABV6MVA5_9PSEU|nr:glycosyltransferase family 1 protein [Kutzneria chonburiensis]
MPELVVLTDQLLAPVPGGTGRYTRELAAALAVTAPDGWTVTGVVARCADPSAARVEGVDGPRMLPVPRPVLARLWQRGVPLWPGGDAVHAPTLLSPTVVKRGRTLVATVHDAVPWTHPETLTPHGAQWHRTMVSRLTRKAGAIVVPTEAVAKELAVHAAGSANVHVIGHGVPDALAVESADADAVARRLALPPRYVLAVGTLEPRKGIDVLIDAMTLPEAPDLPVLLVGATGWGDVDVSSERVRSLGPLPDAELGVVLRRASVLAVPSLAEGFGMPLLEAMAVGVPVVHSDAPALVEVADGAGFVARRGDPKSLVAALRTVVDDPAAARAAITRGLTRAADFSWRRAAETVWNVHLGLGTLG